MLNLSPIRWYQALTNTFPKDPNALEGEASVESTIQPGQAGRIRFQGSSWVAKCMEPLSFSPGDTVYVNGLLEGNTLQVTSR
jgi:membrane protein implicated in regulation of membrane protease activity